MDTQTIAKPAKVDTLAGWGGKAKGVKEGDIVTIRNSHGETYEAQVYRIVGEKRKVITFEVARSGYEGMRTEDGERAAAQENQEWGMKYKLQSAEG